MIKYKVKDFERLRGEYEFFKQSAPIGTILYRPMPHGNILLYTVVEKGMLIFELRVSPLKQSSDDFDELEKFRYNVMEDTMKAHRLIAELEFEGIIVKEES